jgi:nitroreductase
MAKDESSGFAAGPTEAIRSRRSVRKYDQRKVPEGVIDDILDCARLAPTARNAQPWLIGAIRDGNTLGELASLLDHGRFVGAAPLCFAVFTLKDEKYRIEDGCAATMNIILAAQGWGLGTCWVAGDKKSYAEDVRKLLNVPAEYSLLALISTGYPQEAPAAPVKKTARDVTFKDRM